MRIALLTPVIVTPSLMASRDFYVRHLGFRTVFENDWYIHLHGGGDPRTVEMGFMLPDLPEQHPAFRPATNGAGLILNVDVEDASAEFARFQSEGLAFIEKLRDEPWGERHFTLHDPAGLVVNITQKIEMRADFAAQALDPAITGPTA